MHLQTHTRTGAYHLPPNKYQCSQTMYSTVPRTLEAFFWEDRDIIFTDTFVDDAPGDTIIAVVSYLLQCHFFLVEHFE